MRVSSRLFFQLVKAAPEQTVYLTHLKWVTGKKGIQNYFGKYGKIQDVNMFFVSVAWMGNRVQDSKTGLHRGFASVTFAHSDSAKNAVEKGPHVIDGDLVGVNYYMPVKEPMQNFNKV